MKNTKLVVTIFIIFIVFICLHYFIPINSNFDKTYITIATFSFTIFIGFFISRQGNRYSDIRKSVSSIDGNFSDIYRASSHLDSEIQERIGISIKTYYTNILESKVWNYNFLNRTTTLIDIHKCLDTLVPGVQSPVSNATISRIVSDLGNIQIERKALVAMCEERIPRFQWITIFFLSFILLLTLLISIPSNNLFAESLLKGAFSTLVIIIIALLNQFDRLELFEGVIGEHSAQDVIDIIDEKK